MDSKHQNEILEVGNEYYIDSSLVPDDFRKGEPVFCFLKCGSDLRIPAHVRLIKAYPAGHWMNIEDIDPPIHWEEVNKLKRTNISRTAFNTLKKDANETYNITLDEILSWPKQLKEFYQRINKLMLSDPSISMKEEDRPSIGNFSIDNLSGDSLCHLYDGIYESGKMANIKKSEIAPCAVYLSYFLADHIGTSISLLGENGQGPDFIFKTEGALHGLEISQIVSNTAQQHQRYQADNPTPIEQWDGTIFDVTKHYTRTAPKNMRNNEDKFIFNHPENMGHNHMEETYLTSMINTGIDEMIKIITKKTERLSQYGKGLNFSTLILTWRWNIELSHPYINSTNRIHWMLNNGSENKRSYWEYDVSFNEIVILEKNANNETIGYLFSKDYNYKFLLGFRTDILTHKDLD